MKRPQNFHYLIAGGDFALIKAQEKAEDDPHQAVKDLQPLIQGKRAVLYVGVTCAFAAPYVASQLLRLSRRPGAKCVLIGFNPEDRARDLEVENWDKTFADVVRTVSRKRNCMILNPVVGPEPITGSTRMKGGSATKLILETIFALAARQARLARIGAADGSPAEAVHDCIRSYEQTRLAVYEQLADIAPLMQLGGHALRRGRHIYYVGSGAPGVLGIVDASECPPTFGADFEDVRGFVVDGWTALLGRGRDLSHVGPWYRISAADFMQEQLPRLARGDLIVGLPSAGRDAKVQQALDHSQRAGASVAIVQTGASNRTCLPLDAHVCVPQVPRSVVPGADVFREYAIKLIINALTTGAHVLSGKVYGNLMVDLRISNNKLYHRSIAIIQKITGVSADMAKRCLLRSIYGVDRLTPELMRAQPSRHIAAGVEVPKIVPRALIMAGARTTYAQADRLLHKEPIVRSAIERLKKHSKR
jgi:N-acetylmuramic acid 6-phosphate (MurNAc-6-P) etherase